MAAKYGALPPARGRTSGPDFTVQFLVHQLFLRCFPIFSASSFFARLASILLITACGQKHGGTPYGNNPEKHPYGHREMAAGSGGCSDIHADGVPKGAAKSAVANGASAGQPTKPVAAMLPAGLAPGPRSSVH